MQFLYPNEFTGAVAIVGSAERASPRSDFRPGRFHQPSRQMNQRASSQRFAIGCDLRSGRNQMQIGGVRHNLVLRDWRLPIFIPKETSALTDIHFVENGLVGHWPPSHCQINWSQCGITIVVINLPMENSCIQGKMGERFQVKFANFEGLIPRNGIRLHRVGLDQNTRRISNWAMQLMISEPYQSNRSDDSQWFQVRECA